MIGTFLFGAAAYPAIELIWRRRTHPAMALAGGLGLCCLRGVDSLTKNAPLLAAAALGGAGITAIEYGIGNIWNRNFTIWDYRGKPGNVHGQICPAFTLAWCGLSAAAVFGMRLKRKMLRK